MKSLVKWRETVENLVTLALASPEKDGPLILNMFSLRVPDPGCGAGEVPGILPAHRVHLQVPFLSE